MEKRVEIKSNFCCLPHYAIIKVEGRHILSWEKTTAIYKRVKGRKEIILDVKRFLPEELIINGLFIPKFVNSVGKTPMVSTPKIIFWAANLYKKFSFFCH